MQTFAVLDCGAGVVAIWFVLPLLSSFFCGVYYDLVLMTHDSGMR